MCSSPHWQVGLSWFREKLSPANREQRLSRWADFAKNCLPRIGSKELPRFREKYRALGRQKMGSNMRPRYIQFRDIRDRDISGLHCNKTAAPSWPDPYIFIFIWWCLKTGTAHKLFFVEDKDPFRWLVQDCSISGALAMKILQSYTKPLIYPAWSIPLLLLDR